VDQLGHRDRGDGEISRRKVDPIHRGGEHCITALYGDENARVDQ
jgi:hypothetical protein